MATRRTALTGALAVVSSLALLLGALPVTAPAGGALGPRAAAALEAAGPLDRARSELSTTTRSLAELRATVAGVAEEVAVLDTNLLAATTELRALEAELVEARDAHARAVVVVDETRAEVLRRDGALAAAIDAWQADRDRLRSRAVHAYKHGPAGPGDVLVRGVVGAADWHGVAITIETVARLVAADRSTIDVRAEVTRDLAALRAEADLARVAAVAAARVAAEEADRVAALTADAQETTRRIAAVRTERARVLAGLEADAEARAVLVAELEATITRLERSADRVRVTVRRDLEPHGPTPAWAEGLPGQGPRWGAAMEAAGYRHGVDPRLVAALVWTESGFSPGVVSHAGAIGLAQLMPGTARGLGVDPHDPLQNLDGGTRYLRQQLDAFGRVDLALAAYNAGPGRVRRAGGVPNIVETQLHVRRVLERYERLGG